MFPCLQIFSSFSFYEPAILPIQQIYSAVKYDAPYTKYLPINNQSVNMAEVIEVEIEQASEQEQRGTDDGSN